VTLPPEPPPGEELPPPPPPGAEGGECPRCGTPYEPYQEYCLECGLRLPIQRGLIPVLATAWQRRVPWYPGDWIWPVLLALLIAVLAAAGAILATNDNGTGHKTRAVITEPVPVGTGTGNNTGTGPTSPPPPSPSGTGSGTVPTTAPTAPQPPPPPPATGTITSWPAGQNGWTIVLASIPQSAGRAAAIAEARKAIAKGLSQVGVLNSSQFSSLHSGYFVVFSGVYTSESEAKAALSTAKSSYPQAYARQITQ
jgi:hypothetical protein